MYLKRYQIIDKIFIMRKENKLEILILNFKLYVTRRFRNKSALFCSKVFPIFITIVER